LPDQDTAIRLSPANEVCAVATEARPMMAGIATAAVADFKKRRRLIAEVRWLSVIMVPVVVPLLGPFAQY
jgi:hypothetical protein